MHDCQGKEGNKYDHTMSNSRFEVSSGKVLPTRFGNLFQKEESLTEKPTLLRSKRKLRWHRLKPCARRSRSTGASTNSACCKLRLAVIILKAKVKSSRNHRRSKEKIVSRCSRSSYGHSLADLAERHVLTFSSK